MKKISINSKKRIEEKQHINDRLKRMWIHLKRFGNGSDKGGKGEQENSKLISNVFVGNIRTTHRCLLVVRASAVAGFYNTLSLPIFATQK